MHAHTRMDSPAVVPVGRGGAGEAPVRYGYHVKWMAWWANVRCLLAALLPCYPSLRLSPAPVSAPAAASVVRGTIFFPGGGDRRVRLFLHEQPAPAAAAGPAQLLALDLPPGLGGADIAGAGRLVLECQRQWAGGKGGGRGALLEAPTWLVYCNGRRTGFAERREKTSEAEGWVLEKLWAVTAGAGRLPGGGVEYLRGRFKRVVGSSDAESFHLMEPIGWLGVNGGAGCEGGGLSIFFHRV